LAEHAPVAGLVESDSALDTLLQDASVEILDMDVAGAGGIAPEGGDGIETGVQRVARIEAQGE